ncbi:hypothetical protein Q1695_004634 [Nippostrongylus brasiliensis]|nr:hypothetical protein Q1695_004634 [Nippostrongylus brasiliensis]
MKNSRTCSSAVVQVETIYPWDPAKTDFYFELLNNSLKQLEQHSGMTLSSLGEFRRKAAKTTTANQDVYGELFYIPQITKPCSVLKEFVRKAVSWSKDIPRVVLACRCETPVEIYKVNPPREGDKPSSSRNL